ncbi:unnamed protein product [Brassicogethes aeneus]|uniref:Uncharacterized protein n=1 Tax=Brassicogethes aeneus TaxID=1431903 RepID=A0A9P0AUT3_BRAAE|nr:unnamed protein product [Brassicogethes aeneus]
MPPLTKSFIWHYFTSIDQDSAMCNICKKLYSRKGRTTTSLKSHLKSIHPEEYSIFLYADTEQKIKQFEGSDAMPLEQRLKVPGENQDSMLSSQPLSPTKLKVTRQKNPQTAQKSPTPPPVNEEVCLRWNSHHVNMQNTFPTLLLREQYVDVTIVAEGRTLKCHRMILSSCSPYFEEVLAGISPMQHPVLFMKDIPFWILKCLLDFMYAGEVHIFQNKLQDLLNVAEILKIKGLAGTNSNEGSKVDTKESIKTYEEPEKDRKKEEKKQSEIKKEDKKVQNKTPQMETRTHYRTRRNSCHNEDILDPLDLLEPVYEEPAKEERPTPNRTREKYQNIPVRKKLKKRKYTEIRVESPPPVFQTRKGTRSRPNVKVPKYYDGLEEEDLNKNDASVIERQPHINVEDPFLGIVDIKTEPMDFDNDVIEIQDNNVGFSENEEEEAIIGNYDSPILNIAKKIARSQNEDPLSCVEESENEIGLTITNVQSINENSIEETIKKTTENVEDSTKTTTEETTKITTEETTENPEEVKKANSKETKVDSLEDPVENVDTLGNTSKDVGQNNATTEEKTVAERPQSPEKEETAKIDDKNDHSNVEKMDENEDNVGDKKEIDKNKDKDKIENIAEKVTPQSSIDDIQLDFTENIEMTENLTEDFDQNLADLTNDALDRHFNTEDASEKMAMDLEQPTNAATETTEVATTFEERTNFTL